MTTLLERQLGASVALAKLEPRERGLMRLYIDMLQDRIDKLEAENASLKRCVEGDAEFELSADANPNDCMFFKRQI